jgi:hypothetical protein
VPGRRLMPLAVRPGTLPLPGQGHGVSHLMSLLPAAGQ